MAEDRVLEFDIVATGLEKITEALNDLENKIITVKFDGDTSDLFKEIKQSIKNIEKQTADIKISGSFDDKSIEKMMDELNKKTEESFNMGQLSNEAIDATQRLIKEKKRLARIEEEIYKVQSQYMGITDSKSAYKKASEAYSNALFNDKASKDEKLLSKVQAGLWIEYAKKLGGTEKNLKYKDPATKYNEKTSIEDILNEASRAAAAYASKDKTYVNPFRLGELKSKALRNIDRYESMINSDIRSRSKTEEQEVLALPEYPSGLTSDYKQLLDILTQIEEHIKTITDLFSKMTSGENTNEQLKNQEDLLTAIKESLSEINALFKENSAPQATMEQLQNQLDILTQMKDTLQDISKLFNERIPVEPFVTEADVHNMKDIAENYQKIKDIKDSGQMDMKDQAIKTGLKNANIDSTELAVNLAGQYGITDKSTISKLQNQISSLVTGIAKSYDGSKIHLTDASSLDAIEKILLGNYYEEDPQTGIYDEFYNYFKSKKIYISDAQKSAMDKDQYKNLIRNFVGKITTDPSKGMSVNELWGEMNEKFPNLFPESITNPTDQIIKAFDIYAIGRNDKTRKVDFKNLPKDKQEFISENISSSVVSLVSDIGNSLQENISSSYNILENEAAIQRAKEAVEEYISARTKMNEINAKDAGGAEVSLQMAEANENVTRTAKEALDAMQALKSLGLNDEYSDIKNRFENSYGSSESRDRLTGALEKQDSKNQSEIDAENAITISRAKNSVDEYIASVSELNNLEAQKIKGVEVTNQLADAYRRVAEASEQATKALDVLMEKVNDGAISEDEYQKIYKDLEEGASGSAKSQDALKNAKDQNAVKKKMATQKEEQARLNKRQKIIQDSYNEQYSLEKKILDLKHENLTADNDIVEINNGLIKEYQNQIKEQEIIRRRNSLSTDDFSSIEKDYKKRLSNLQAEYDAKDEKTIASYLKKDQEQQDRDFSSAAKANLDAQVDAYQKILSLQNDIERNKGDDSYIQAKNDEIIELTNSLRILEDEWNQMDFDKAIQNSSEIIDQKTSATQNRLQRTIENNDRLATSRKESILGNFDSNQITTLSIDSGKIDTYTAAVAEFNSQYKAFLESLSSADLADNNVFSEMNEQAKELKDTLSDLQSDKWNTFNATGKNAGKVIDLNISDLRSARTTMEAYARSMGEISDAGLRWNSNNTKLSYSIKNQNGELEKYVLTLDEATQKVRLLNQGTTAAPISGFEKFSESLTRKWKDLGNYLLSFGTMQELWQQVRQGFSVITELDTAFTEMQKVSDSGAKSLKEFAAASYDIGQSLGTTGEVIQNSTADWMRLGESLEDAQESAKVTTTLLNVSEFDNIEDATEAMVAMSQAYSDMDKIDIVDKLNNVGVCPNI